MDKIIYLYQLKHKENAAESWCREEIQLKDYRLLRVGMSERILRLNEGQSFAVGKGFLAGRKRKRQRVLELQEVLEFREMLFAEPDNTRLVYENGMSAFAGWEFNEYFEADWVRHMLRYAKFPHFVILGQAVCLSEIIYGYVRKIKSLQWILPARQYREEQQFLVESLYEDYGLAVKLCLLEGQDYRRAGISCYMPSVFLDFCQEEKIPVGNIAEGSIWLDMTSSEEKRRRMEGRATKIAYFSLKKEWSQPQKALNYLDTIGKNGYNT